jgi:hypothetical protein
VLNFDFHRARRKRDVPLDQFNRALRNLIIRRLFVGGYAHFERLRNTLYTFDSASGAFRRKFLGIVFHVAVQSHHGAADTDADVGGVYRWIEWGYELLQLQFLR